MRLAFLVILPAFFLGSISYFLFSKPDLENPLVLAAVTANTIEYESQSVTPTPTFTPTPTASPTPKISPPKKKKIVRKPIVATSPVVSVGQYLLNEVNAYRSSLGLSFVSSDPHSCNFARLRVQEVSQAFNHDGFRNRLQSNTLPYPGYKEVTENIAMNPDYKQVVANWKASAGHAENMRKDTPFVCIEQSGNFYVYEGWKP